MMTRQAEAAPLTQITPGSGRVELRVGWDAFYEKFKTIYLPFWKVYCNCSRVQYWHTNLSNLVQLITAVTLTAQESESV